MRPIKFRAWDKRENKMFNVGVMDLDATQAGDYYNWHDSYWGTRIDYTDSDGKWGAIMQFTGLLDKNGKEIYEGDILTSLYKRDGCDGLYKVEWYNGGFLPLRHGNHQQKMVVVRMSDLESCEVIGNIYENPELLTK